jgi:hypothetical protein
MSSHSIPETQAAVPTATVTPGITPDMEIDLDALSLLREFFLLLDEWDRQGGQS